jgi:hypothetical protein
MGPVAPPQPPELSLVHRLRTDREAVDAGDTEPGQVSELVSAGVGLERDLGVGRDPQPGSHVLHQRVDLASCHQRGRSAPDVDADQRGAIPSETFVQARGPQGQLGVDSGQQRRDTVARPTSLGSGHDHEVAVGTERDAEREVDVQPFGRAGLGQAHAGAPD